MSFLNWLFDGEPQEPTQREVSNLPSKEDLATLPMDDPAVYTSSMEQETPTDIVSKAYEPFDDNDFNIFTVEELYSNFEGIPEDTKNQLIQKNLRTLGIDLNTVIYEAIQRKESISTVTQEYISYSENLGHEIETKIADARKLIDELSTQNIERKNKLENEMSASNAEIARLNKIIHILGGEA